MPLASQVEALLFHKNEPLKITWLAKVLGKSDDEILDASKVLRESLGGRGVVLVEANNMLSLGTHPDMSGLIEKITKDDLNRDIGKAGMETLAIVAYKGPISRSSIDYIRGVNSQFIVRNLLARGLVEKVPDEKDGRSYLYRPTTALFLHLGISKLDELPKHAELCEQLSKIEHTQNAD